jgi:hypothetical protein
VAGQLKRWSLVAFASALAGVGVAAAQRGGDRSEDGRLGSSCSEADYSFRAETLNDLRSFADALVIVRATGERTPPPPGGPEGWAGLIGRRVDARIERVLWRRPRAPGPPRTFTFSDYGWTGTLKHRRPWHACNATRMEIGRRYLAPVARLADGVWYPLDQARLRLRGDRVVGGVDAGEPSHGHRALAGRTTRGATKTLSRTLPYRATVTHPLGDPAKRWNRAYRDRFRVWRVGRRAPFTIASGVTARARWELYGRLARRGLCLGIAARPLWPRGLSPSGEGCGPRQVGPTEVTLGRFASDERGAFAYGRAGRDVVSVRVAGEGTWSRVVATTFTPSPPGGDGRFWVLPTRTTRPILTVEGLDRDGRVVGRPAQLPAGAARESRTTMSPS